MTRKRFIKLLMRYMDRNNANDMCQRMPGGCGSYDIQFVNFILWYNSVCLKTPLQKPIFNLKYQAPYLTAFERLTPEEIKKYDPPIPSHYTINWI